MLHSYVLYPSCIFLVTMPGNFHLHLMITNGLQENYSYNYNYKFLHVVSYSGCINSSVATQLATYVHEIIVSYTVAILVDSWTVCMKTINQLCKQLYSYVCDGPVTQISNLCPLTYKFDELMHEYIHINMAN